MLRSALPKETVKTITLKLQASRGVQLRTQIKRYCNSTFQCYIWREEKPIFQTILTIFLDPRNKWVKPRSWHDCMRNTSTFFHCRLLIRCLFFSNHLCENTCSFRNHRFNIFSEVGDVWLFSHIVRSDSNILVDSGCSWFHYPHMLVFFIVSSFIVPLVHDFHNTTMKASNWGVFLILAKTTPSPYWSCNLFLRIFIVTETFSGRHSSML